MFAAPESLAVRRRPVAQRPLSTERHALRLVRRRVQDADQIVRPEADGDQGVTDLGYQRTQDSRDLLAYLQSASHPPLLGATLAIAVAAAERARARAPGRGLPAGLRRDPPAPADRRSARPVPPASPRPADAVRGYDDVLTAEQVAAMMALGTHPLGSRRGFYLGHTLGGSRHPVRFNLREGSDTDRNAAILSLGALGSGKTTLDQKLLYEGFLLGARIIDCDPKGDHRMHRLDDVARHVETIALRPDRALRGMLDPLRVAPDHMRHDAAVSFLCDLLPARSDAAWETSVVAAVDAVVNRAGQPTCFEVVRALSAGDETDRQVAKTLVGLRRAGLTQLGFADPDVRLPPVGGRQVTYIPIRDLPAPSRDPARRLLGGRARR